MSCREFTDLILEYLFGTGLAAERVEFDRHLAECSDCVAYLDSYQKTIQIEQAVFSNRDDAGSFDVPDELVQAILHTWSRDS